MPPPAIPRTAHHHSCIKRDKDGYYLVKRSSLPAVYGMASGFLKHARKDYESLQEFVRTQVRGLEMAYAYLSLRS